MDHVGSFMISHTFLNVEHSMPGNFNNGKKQTFNGMKCWIWCKKRNESNWDCQLLVWKYPPPSLGWKVEYKIRTKNGVETVGTADERILNAFMILFRHDPKYFVNGNMTIECHVELYEIDENGIRKPPTVIENETGIGLHDQKNQLTTEEKELQTAILLSKKEFEQHNKKDNFSCNICLEKYGEEGDRTPRVLDCGHTLCLGCCQIIARPHEIQCPFCRVVTQLTGRTIYNLPKNYLALSM